MPSTDLAEFTAEEYADRLAALRRLMAEAGLDAVLLTTDTNHRYFTGHWTHRWLHKFTTLLAVLPVDRDPVLIVPPLEAGICAVDTWIQDVRVYPPPIRVHAGITLAAEAVRDLGLENATVGAELGGVLWSRMPYGDFQELGRRLPGVTFVDASESLWRSRFRKSPAELDCIRRAVSITDEAYRSLFESFRPGITEREVHRLLAVRQLECGADAPGSITVASHPARDLQPFDRSHRRPTDRPIREGDLVIIDAGCVYRGYWSDYTRMFVVGRATVDCERAYGTIYESLQDALAATRPGARAQDLVAAGARRMATRGFEPQARAAAGAGHAMGLDIIEPPFLEIADETTLEPGMVLTVEPSMVTDHGFFMLEEDIVVTDDGYELLSAPVSETLPVL